MSQLAGICLDLALRHAPGTRSMDRALSRLHFRLRNGRWPGSRSWLNDAMYDLKVSDEILSPLRVLTTDKHHAKAHIADRIGSKHVVPTLMLLTDPSAVDNTAFPERCIIKPTHASGEVIRRWNAEPVDRGRVKSWFSLNYYHSWREANYRTLIPRVIVEPFVFDDRRPNDVKLFCRDSRVRFIGMNVHHPPPMRREIFARDLSPVHALKDGRVTPSKVRPPENIAAMIEAAETIAADFSGLVRIDFYSNGVGFFVGEITHVNASACDDLICPEAEERIGRLLHSPP